MTLRSPRVSEKAEQAAIVQLLESLGAKVYVLGTTRAKKCHACGETTKDFSTRQTPGIGDIYAILPPPPAKRARLNNGRLEGSVPSAHHWTLWVEAKAKDGRPSPAQDEFQDLCLKAWQSHVMGGIDVVQNWLVDHGWLKESQRRTA